MHQFSDLSDEELVARVRTNDPELYAEVVRRYQDKLMRYASHLTHDEHAAVDAVQQGFINAFINLRGFDTSKKFSSWIYRIVHNQVINKATEHEKEIPLPEDFDVRSDENLEDEYDKGALARMVASCLSKMPILYSEPLTLYYIEDKSYEEISDILRVPMGTVATRIRRAKAMMKLLCPTN